MSLADYLAKKYLTADHSTKKSGKKRKRKTQSSGKDDLLIKDDDVFGWNLGMREKEAEDSPMTVSGHSADFRKSKKSNWTTVQTGTASLDQEQAAADAIIASAEAENRAHGEAEMADEMPGVMEISGAVLRMENGARAGLQTASEVGEALRLQEAAVRRRLEKDGAKKSGKGEETIYRDASGRIINVAMQRAEARRKAEENEKKKLEAVEALKGDVQLAEKEKRKQQLQEAKYMTVTRYADDSKLNEEMKERERWNDPAAMFLTKKKEGKSITGKPLYAGAAPPNRYGIKPGHKWDGVDRSNGFEKDYFIAQNRRANVKNLQYAWQMDE